MAREKNLLQRIARRAEYETVLALKHVYHEARSWRGTNNERELTFVAGVQRSGTNMLMDVLEQSFATDVYHERDTRAFDHYQMRDTHTIQTLVEKSKAPKFIIKSLCELQHLTQLMEQFAPAKVVWIVRDYHDVVNSMLVSFGNQAKQVLRIREDRSSDGWLGEGMSDTTHALLRRLAHANIDDSSAAALSWCFRNILFFEQGFHRDSRVKLVRYESLVNTPATQFPQIFDFIGIPYRPWHSRKVVASSIRRRTPPVIEAPVRAACDELLQRFDALVPLTAEGSS